MAGTVGGTTLVVLLYIGTEKIIETIVLAIIGAAVSFSVSVFLKWVIKKIGSKK